MTFIDSEHRDGIAFLYLNRGKVNAINGELVEELREALRSAETSNAVVLSGRGKFFSFGFDIPELLSFSREDFTQFVTRFTELYTELFTFSRPVVAALNGHAIAGGCMLALACDARVMVAGGGKISLNEIGFGSSVFAGSAEMLRFAVGGAMATEVLYSGAMYGAEDAKRIGLAQETAEGGELLACATRLAADLGSRDRRAFTSMKSLLRGPVAEEMRRREKSWIPQFVDIWYSPSTWARLQEIKIR